MQAGQRTVGTAALKGLPVKKRKDSSRKWKFSNGNCRTACSSCMSPIALISSSSTELCRDNPVQESATVNARFLLRVRFHERPDLFQTDEGRSRRGGD